MFNESNSKIDAESYIYGFPLMPNNELPAFLASNNLSFSVEQIAFIRDYYRNVKKALPTYNQLMFFDTINKIRQSQKKGYCIYSASADDGANVVMQSSKDLLAKSKVIKHTFSGAMPLSFASKIASQYLNYIGYSKKENYFINAENASSYKYYIHTDNGTPLFIYSNDVISNNDSQISSNPLHNTIVMLYPIDSAYDDDYSNHVNQLLSMPEINTIISKHIIVDNEYGLFGALLNEKNGILVNLSSIPQIEKDENGKVLYLTSLVSDCIGKHIFSTNNASIGTIKQLADLCSLKVCILASKNNSHLLTLESTKNPAFSFDISFLEKITNFKEHREYIFSSETNYPLDKKEKVYITDNSSFPCKTHSADRLLNFGKAIASASSRELKFSPHKSAATAVIDSINALIAKGTSKNSITLSIYYSLRSGTDDNRELGKNLASILGAYRTMVELCISDTKPQIGYDTRKRSITVLASSKTPKKQIKSIFSNNNSHIYFYHLKFTDEGLPNYKKYREFIKYYYSLTEDDAILSAIAINENFIPAFQNAAQNINVIVEPELDYISFSEAHGILFETKEMIAITDDIFYIGHTEEK